MAKTGNLFVVAAPSGTGKTTLVKALVEALAPELTVSISHTTRAKRPAEIDNVNYHFVDKNTFQTMIEQHEFLEYATVFNHSYGTSRAWVEATLKKGIDVILEIDWQGCQQIQKLFPNCIAIFILPPSLKALSERLTLRNQDKPEIIQQRLADAQETIQHVTEYDYILVNDDFAATLEDLKAIILAANFRKSLQIPRLERLLSELGEIAD